MTGEMITMDEIKEVLKIGGDLMVYFKEVARAPIAVERIHGGVSWPGAESPGYVCLIGQCRQMKNSRKPIILLKEAETENLNELFTIILEDSRKMQCGEFHADTNEGGGAGSRDFIQAADEYLTRRGAGARVFSSPSSDWQVMVYQIQTWAQDGALSIDRESILGRQLGAMTKENLKAGQRAGFYAVNALGCLLEEFDRKPVDIGSIRTVPAWP
jgi:hypothetical protein